MPKPAIEFGYDLYSQQWGILRKDPYPFNGQWERLGAAANALSLSQDARKRAQWFVWCYTKGKGNVRATCRHFGIAPKVFYFWKKRLTDRGLLSLENYSSRPHTLRRPNVHVLRVDRMISLRRAHMHYSKMKLAVLYREQYGEAVSSWQFQKIIHDFGLYRDPKKAAQTARKRKRSLQKKRITDLVKKAETGFLFSIDTVVLWIEGRKRYILTAIDRHSRFAYARMYATHSSKAAADFLRRLYLLMEGKMVHVQTDNGSEFHKHFERALLALGLDHWWSRVSQPKDNAIGERFNRTLQEEFVQMGNAYVDPEAFNRRLTEWLVEYDFYRPHQALGYKRPAEVASGDSKALPMCSSYSAS